jgi:hypothetical protein
VEQRLFKNQFAAAPYTDLSTCRSAVLVDVSCGLGIVCVQLSRYAADNSGVCYVHLQAGAAPCSFSHCEHTSYTATCIAGSIYSSQCVCKCTCGSCRLNEALGLYIVSSLDVFHGVNAAGLPSVNGGNVHGLAGAEQLALCRTQTLNQALPCHICHSCTALGGATASSWCKLQPSPNPVVLFAN